MNFQKYRSRVYEQAEKILQEQKKEVLNEADLKAISVSWDIAFSTVKKIYDSEILPGRRKICGGVMWRSRVQQRSDFRELHGGNEKMPDYLRGNLTHLGDCDSSGAVKSLGGYKKCLKK